MWAHLQICETYIVSRPIKSRTDFNSSLRANTILINTSTKKSKLYSKKLK